MGVRLGREGHGKEGSSYLIRTGFIFSGKTEVYFHSKITQYAEERYLILRDNRLVKQILHNTPPIREPELVPGHFSCFKINKSVINVKY